MASDKSSNPGDAFDLQRFVDAQDRVYDTVLAELRAGRKRSHWIWFVFPQLRGLGSSPIAQRYGIASLEEARAYLAHGVLGRGCGSVRTWSLAVRRRAPRTSSAGRTTSRCGRR